MENKVPVSEISAKFHMTIIQMFTDLCEEIRMDTSLSRVALSGGVFQNSIILTGLIRLLKKRNFQVFTHQHVPTNDGGISLGQAIIAAAVSGNQS
jgi:hydrogenase maturation protein HypF